MSPKRPAPGAEGRPGVANPWGLLYVAAGGFVAYVGVMGIGKVSARKAGQYVPPKSEQSTTGNVTGASKPTEPATVTPAPKPKSSKKPYVPYQRPAPYNPSPSGNAYTMPKTPGKAGYTISPAAQRLLDTHPSKSAKGPKVAKAAFATQPPTSAAASQALNRQNEATRSEVPNIKGL